MRVRRRIDMPSGRVSRSHAAKATGSGPASTRQIGLGGGTGASHSLDEDESEMPPPTARAQAGTAQQTINKVTASGTHCTGQETIRHRQERRDTAIVRKNHKGKPIDTTVSPPNKVHDKVYNHTEQGGRTAKRTSHHARGGRNKPESRCTEWRSPTAKRHGGSQRGQGKRPPSSDVSECTRVAAVTHAAPKEVEALATAIRRLVGIGEGLHQVSASRAHVGSRANEANLIDGWNNRRRRRSRWQDRSLRSHGQHWHHRRRRRRHLPLPLIGTRRSRSRSERNKARERSRWHRRKGRRNRRCTRRKDGWRKGSTSHDTRLHGGNDGLNSTGKASWIGRAVRHGCCGPTLQLAQHVASLRTVEPRRFIRRTQEKRACIEATAAILKRTQAVIHE